jgi:cytochrome c biogenesis protein CcmG, thiol:disulfide interchange protein DsbE
VVRHKGFRIAAVVLLMVAYMIIYYRAALLEGPSMALPTPQERVPFTVDFPLPDIQGHLVRPSDLRGRPVLINFWATWCSPCREEMPSMNALYKDYHAKGLAIVAIAIDIGGKAVVAPFMQAYGLTFPVLLDPQNMLGQRLQVPGIPTSYLLDKQGRIIGLVIGARDWNTRKIRYLVEQLLAEEGGGTTP